MLCRICRFTVEVDDVVVGQQGGVCICLRCFNRETGTELAMPKQLRRDLEHTLSNLSITR